MNRNVERSSNVLMDKTPSAGILARWGIGRTQGTSQLHEEGRAHSSQKLRVDEWRKRSNSLSKRFLSPLLSTMRGVIDEGRMILQGLRPPATPSTRLEHAFFEILDEVARDARPRFRIVVTGQTKTLSSAIEEKVYLIQREVLINAIRHSNATSIEAELEYLPRRLRMVIRDTGRGFEPKTLKMGRGSSRGLQTMVERAKALDAQFQIWSKPGSGTEVERSLPFDPRSMSV